MNFDKRQIKAIFITGIVILFVILAFLIISIATISNNEKENATVNIDGAYASIKELVEHFGCEYKNDTYRADRDFPIEVTLVFKHQLYENDKSQEEFFNEIITELAKFVRYKSFKMLDKENDITIQVICENNRIGKIIINDLEDYFIYMDSQLELTQYKEIEPISLNSEVEAINFLIDNKWSTDVNFGTREAIFRNYNIHFEEGVKYRKIGSEVYNVIFTEKYTNPVISNIKVGTSLSSVKEILGTPTFEDEDLGVIGYKGRSIYAFFTEDEISIYKNKYYVYDDFWKLVDKFLEDENMEFKDFMNELTYIWRDYSEYTYGEDNMFMAFPNKGVEIKLNYDGISGIVLYNNISEDLNKVKKYLNNTEFVSRLKLDSVFEAEKRRIKSDKDFVEECKKADEEQESTSMLFYNYLEKDERQNTIKTYFLSKTGEFPNRELIEQVDTYVWISDNYFVYSIYQQGIYCFNATTGEKFIITEEKNKNFSIEGFENNVLKYDGKEIVLEF